MPNIRPWIERQFENFSGTVFDHRFKTIGIMLVLIAAAACWIPGMDFDASTEGMLHPEAPELLAYNSFREQFGREELIVLGIKPPEIFDTEFLKRLGALKKDIEERVPLLEEVTCLINARSTRGEGDQLIVEELLENMPETDEEMVRFKERVLTNPAYKNTIISPDGKLTTIVIKTRTHSEAAEEVDIINGFDGDSDKEKDKHDAYQLSDEDYSRIIEAIHEIVAEYDTQDFKVYMAGSPVVSHFLKESLIRNMTRFLFLSTAAIALLLYLMFRKPAGVIIPLLIVLLSLVTTIGIMGIFSITIKMPTQILPSFLMAVGVGDTVHVLAIFFMKYNETGNKRDAITHAMGHSGLAILMTSLTTAGGLLSFSTSGIAPIADLGIYASAGVILAFVYTVILLPALLAVFPIQPAEAKENIISGSVMDRLLSGIGGLSTKYPVPIIIIAVVVSALSINGITRIRFSHDPLKWFPEGNKIRTDTEVMDKIMGGSVTLEVLVDTKKNNSLYESYELKRLDKTASEIYSAETGGVSIGKILSLTTILKEINRALNENNKDYYTIPDDKNLIAQEFLLFENSGSDDLKDFTDSGFRTARVTIWVPAMDAIEYSNFINIVSEHFRKNFLDAETGVTGMVTLLFTTMTNAIDSMLKSYKYALIVITVLMILLIGRVKIGLLSMIPNLVPIVIILGIMGWLDIPMNIDTMLVGSIAIGLAVDDTVHFMHNFRRYFEETGDPVFAVKETLHTAGRAMFVTTCVLSTAAFIFMFAEMTNMVDFGMLLGIVIILALLSDYFLAPALMILVNRPEKSGREIGS